MDQDEQLHEPAETVVPPPPPEPTVLSNIGISRQEFSRITDGRYELQDEIGRGGMGTVLRGRDPVLNRDLAIKFLRNHQADSPEVAERFLKEAQINGQLQHPGIVPVYELGQLNQQVPFIAMKLVDGDTLQTLLSKRESVRENQSRFLGIFEQVCQTMAYAHSRNVIHRDLKPSNVMVGAFGEVQVMDWGVAKVIEEYEIESTTNKKPRVAHKSGPQKIRTGDSSTDAGAHTQTSLGAIIGTPGYMPPEQAQGAISLVDKQSDVFGLGAILCVILTGKPPHTGKSREAICQESAAGNIDSALKRLSSCDADQELVELAVRCLSTNKLDRPDDASEVAEELAAYFTSVQTRLRQAELDKTKSIEEKKRRRITVGLAVSMLTSLLIGAAAWIWIQSKQTEIDQANLVAANVEIERQKELTKLGKEASERETNLREQAQTAQRKAEVLLADVFTSRGLDAAEGEDPGYAVMWFGSAAATANQVDVEREDLSHLRASNWLQHAIIPVGAIKVEKPLGMEFQPLGNALLVRFAKQLKGKQWVEHFTIFDWQTNQAKPWLPQNENQGYACWSRDGTKIAMTNGLKSVEIRQSNTGEVLSRFELTTPVSRMAFDSSGERLAVATNSIRIWSLSRDRFESFRFVCPKEVHSLKFNPSNKRLSAATYRDRAYLFSVPSPTDEIEQKDINADMDIPHFVTRGSIGNIVQGPAWDVGHADRLIAVDDKNQVTFWDAQTKQQTLTVKPQIESIGKVEVSPCGNWFAVGGFGGPQVRSMKKPAQIVMNLKHRNYAGAFKFGRGGTALVTGSLDNTTQICSLPSPDDSPPDSNLVEDAIRQKNRNLFHDSGVCDVSTSDSDKWLATATVNGLIRIWKFPAPWNRRGMHRSVIAMRTDVSPCNRYAICGKFDGILPADDWSTDRVQMYLAKSGFPIARPMSVPGAIHDTSFNVDGSRVLIASEESGQGSISVWDVGTGGTLIESLDLAGVPHYIRNSPMRNEVAVFNRSNQLELIDLNTGQSRFLTPVDKTEHQYLPRIKWLPDGSKIIVLSGNAFCLINADTGELELENVPFENKLDEIPVIAVTPDSRFIAIGAMNWVKFWDLENGKPVYQPLPHPRTSPSMGAVAELNFDPTGERLVTAGLDKRARVWDWKTGELHCPPLNHEDEVLSSIFSPDGRFVVTGSRGEHCGPHFWDCYTGKKIAPSCEADSKRNSQAIYDLALSSYAGQKGIHFLFSMGNNALDHEQFQIFQHDIRFFKSTSKLNTEELVTFGELATSKSVVSGEPDALAGDKWYSRWLDFHQRQPEFGLKLESRDFMWHIMRIIKLMQLREHQFAIEEIDRFRSVVDATPEFPELNRNVMLCLNAVNRAEILKAQGRFKEMNSTLDSLHPRVELLATKYHDDLFAMDAMGAMVSGMHAFRRVNGFSPEQVALGKQLDQLSFFGRSKLAAAMLVENRLILAAKLHKKDLLEEHIEPRKMLLGSLIHQRMGEELISQHKLTEAIAAINSETEFQLISDVISLVLKERLANKPLAAQRKLVSELAWHETLKVHGQELCDQAISSADSERSSKDVRSANSEDHSADKR